MSRKAIVAYCALVLAVGWALESIAAYKVGLDSPGSHAWMAAGMWSPTLVTLGFLVFHKPARKGVLWKPGNLLYLPLGVLVSVFIAFGTVAIAHAAGWGKSGYFEFAAQGVTISGGPWKLGKGLQSWPLFGANVLVTGAFFAVFNCVVAVGEEFAWRGFLQGHLIARLGTIRALVALGLFWAAWHLPLLLAGYNYPDHPVLGAFVLFPITLVADSFFLGWLTLKARSFWPAAIAHGATNGIETGVIGNLKLSAPQSYIDLTRLALAVIVGLLAWAALVGARRRRDSVAEPRPSFAA